MNFSSIRQNLDSIDYAWTKPQTYLVLVPGLSLIIQKVQLANTMPLIKSADVTQHNADQANAKSRKFANICKWHLRGSMIQIAAFIIAINIFAAPLFSLLAIFSMYELVDTKIKSVRNHPIKFFEFHSNGNIKSIEYMCACNIF